MNKSDFNYDLPKELIAQDPVEPRDHSRLLIMNRKSGELEDRIFYQLTDYLHPGDCLILNDSRVLPARLYGNKKESGGSVELLLLHPRGGNRWEVLAGPENMRNRVMYSFLETGCLRLRFLILLMRVTGWLNSSLKVTSTTCLNASAKCPFLTILRIIWIIVKDIRQYTQGNWVRQQRLLQGFTLLPNFFLQYAIWALILDL
jgi:hypothetical protein